MAEPGRSSGAVDNYPGWETVADEHAYPPLTVDDAEGLVRDLQAALTAHYAWIAKFEAMLVCRTRPSRTDLAPDTHLRDDFGRWYRHESTEYLRHNPEFLALGRHHREMHDSARDLAHVVAEGGRIAPPKFRAFQRTVERFRECVNSVLSEAQKLLRYTDPLTGLATRFAMLPLLDQERERVARTGEPSSVGMVDLDRFKEVNDTWGHNAGDIVLQEVAHFLLKNVRRYDQVCRYGGEEFVVLLPGTEPRRAKRVLDRLRRGLSRRRIGIGGKNEVSVSASFGIASLRADKSVMTAIDHADQAMYAAKRAGRNRVRIWPEDDIKGD